jgi:hypothetical protein
MERAGLSGRWRPYQLLALGASLATHVALSLAFHAGGNRQEDSARGKKMPSSRFTVELIASQRIDPKPALDRPDAPAPTAPELFEAMPAPPEKKSLLAIAKPPEPHYFRTTEVSAKPFILQDLPVELGQLFPGVPPQSAVFLLFINEQGNIDRVTIEDTELPEQSRQILSDAFANLTFHPAQIDDIPVRSQMKIEITIEGVKPQPAADSTP